MSELEDHLRLLRPRKAPPGLWKRIRSGGPRRREWKKEIVMLVAASGLIGFLVYLLSWTPLPMPVEHPVKGQEPPKVVEEEIYRGFIGALVPAQTQTDASHLEYHFLSDGDVYEFGDRPILFADRKQFQDIGGKRVFVRCRLDKNRWVVVQVVPLLRKEYDLEGGSAFSSTAEKDFPLIIGIALFGPDKKPLDGIAEMGTLHLSGKFSLRIPAPASPDVCIGFFGWGDVNKNGRRDDVSHTLSSRSCYDGGWMNWENRKYIRGRALTLQKRKDNGPYDGSAYSFRFQSAEFDVHKNYVDLNYNGCGLLHINMYGRSNNRIVDLGKVAFSTVVESNAEKWNEQEILPEAGHVYFLKLGDGEVGLPPYDVKILVLAIDPDAIHLEWAPIGEEREPVEPFGNRGAAGTMGQCGVHQER